MNRQTIGRGTAKLIGNDAAVNHLLRGKRQPRGHLVEELPMTLFTALDDHRIGIVVEVNQIDVVLDKQCLRGLPVVDVQGHRAAIGMGKTDAEVLRQIGLRAQSVFLLVPTGSAWAFGALRDGHQTPTVPDVKIN